MSGVTRFEDLAAWQFSVEFRDYVYEITENGPALKDPKYRTQIRDSTASAPRNIAEGFLKYDPPENARYVNIAKGSLGEALNDVLHGRKQKYFTEEQFEAAWRLGRRALKAVKGYHRYLRSCSRRGPWGQNPQNPNPEPEPQNPAEPREPRGT